MTAVFAAHTVSMMGTIVAEVALSILVYERTKSSLLSALVFVCSFLPYAVGGTFLSAIADRFPTRRVLVLCDLTSGTLIAIMLVPGVPIWLILVLLFGTGLVAPVFQGARAASLAVLLGPAVFPLGRSLLRLVSQTAVLLGFAAGGILVAAIGPRWLLAADVASFVASAVVIGVGTPFVPAHAHGEDRSVATMARASVAGLRYVFTDRRLRWLVPLSWTAAMFMSSIDGIAVAYTAQIGVATASAAALFAAASFGTVLGEVVMARRRPSTKRRLLLPFAILSQVPVLGFLAEPPIWLASGLLVVAGFGFAYNQAVDPLILAATDPIYRGRLFTVQMSGLMSVQGVGIAVAGAVSTIIAPGVVIAGAGAIGAVVITFIAIQATRGP